MFMISCRSKFASFCSSAALIGIALSYCVIPWGNHCDAAELEKEKVDFFEAKVRPVLIQHCYECHSKEAGEASGKLRLDSRNAWMSGGTRGQAIIPGNPDQSLVLRAVNYKENDMQMPPDGRSRTIRLQI